MPDEPEPPADVDPGRSASRSELLPEEREPGSDDPDAQAATILEDSEARQGDRNAAPDAVVEHRRSEDTVEPPA